MPLSQLKAEGVKCVLKHSTTNGSEPASADSAQIGPYSCADQSTIRAGAFQKAQAFICTEWVTQYQRCQFTALSVREKILKRLDSVRGVD